MKVHISRWGNSLAIRIPRASAETAGLQEGMAVDLVAEADRIVVHRARPSLAELLNGIDESVQEETDWGSPAGKEAW